MRAAALGLGLAGALVLTACTDDGGSDGGSGEGSAGGDKSSAAPSGSASTDPVCDWMREKVRPFYNGDL
ncbi:hypothetical protein [Streptomyces tendae]